MSPMGPPDPAIVSAMLDDSSEFSKKPWNQRDYQRLNGPINREIEMGFSHRDLTGAQRMTGQQASILQNIPYAHNEREHYEMIQYFDEESDSQLYNVGGAGYGEGIYQHPRAGNASMTADQSGWIHPDNQLPLGSAYNNLAEEPLPFAAGAADMTEVPTSTTNPLRPRTIAAGYNREAQVLTVMFRDGTLYNYFSVTATQWYNFRRARSKGRFIYTYLDQKPRGLAEPGSLTPGAAEAFARVARTAQKFKGGLNDNHSENSRRGARGSYRTGNLGSSTRKKSRNI